MAKRDHALYGRDDGLDPTLRRNIETLVRRKEQEDASAPLQERIAIAITRFAGSMPFVYLHAVVFGFWILVNIGWLPLMRPWDPSLVVLAMIASVEAIFLTIFVLITQNRMSADDEKRANLDLQISLLSET